MGDCLEQFCFILVMVLVLFSNLLIIYLVVSVSVLKKIALAAYHLVIFFMHGILKKYPYNL